MVRIKICGITSVADAEIAARLGADAIGLNFYAGSPRCLSEERAQAILARLPPLVEPIGLFVNEPFAALHAVAQRLGLRTLQVHGARLEVLPAGPYRYIPAFAVRDAASLAALDAYVASCREHMPAAVLVDAHVPGAYGGTGRQAPWELLATYRAPAPLILAGGLTADNVAEAIRQVRPYGVDVASGVESSPGVKDAEKMRRFIEAVRLA
jgi:phosphoribosylanthranilate isomerase